MTRLEWDDATALISLCTAEDKYKLGTCDAILPLAIDKIDPIHKCRRSVSPSTADRSHLDVPTSKMVRVEKAHTNSNHLTSLYIIL